MSKTEKYTLGEASAISALLAVGVPVMIAVIGVVSLPFALWRAYVITKLWTWFVLPTFHIPTPSVWMVYGLSVVYGLWTADSTVKKVKEETNWKSTLSMMACGPAISLLCGYLVYHYALHGR